MTGPQHVKLAESFLNDARTTLDRDDKGHFIAMAQVHATLALAAATIDDPPEDGGNWVDAFTDQRWADDT